MTFDRKGVIVKMIGSEMFVWENWQQEKDKQTLKPFCSSIGPVQLKSLSLWPIHKYSQLFVQYNLIS